MLNLGFNQSGSDTTREGLDSLFVSANKSYFSNPTPRQNLDGVFQKLQNHTKIHMTLPTLPQRVEVPLDMLWIVIL